MAANKNKGVALTEEQDVGELEVLKPGTPVAIRVEGRWWPYLKVEGKSVRPVGQQSYDDAEQALQVAAGE
ncbi:hypothetical protein APB26_32495 [Pseudomonas aeruginosa]|uniref:hypothetical protein n=1 Tax=Pseudomonas aeruginosa TaxID=287 RepID=UPI00071B1449|nr:hypothetical protein [Pseudomonas aeruginosa]KSQ21702.1 hypothetical protein APB26_32495 [Pseudomonas aeruginosa]RPV61374.1 hypothetical protein IPC838_18825 [Pseudomonas aeruginosa]